jgi:molybdenum cofactor guanylyltransferase
MGCMITGIILAGGAGSRFHGITKPKILIEGRTIISRITDVLEDVFDEIILVTNSPAEFDGNAGYRIINDSIPDIGPLGGIHAALNAASGEAIFVFAGDMPLLDKKIITRQIDYYNSLECDVLIPRIGEYIEPLHAIYNISILKHLNDYLAKHDNYAVRDFIKLLKVKYMQIDQSAENKNAFTNINSPEDIRKIGRILGKTGK